MLNLKLFLIWIALCLGAFSTTKVEILSNYITDKSSKLSSNQIKTIESRLRKIDKNSGNQIIILLMSNIEGFTIEEYAIEIATKNQIGQADLDNGLLFLFDMTAREVRIEVGYGLEDIITDAKSAQIIREEIVPHFKRAQYYEGISSAISSVTSLLSIGEVDLSDITYTQPVREQAHWQPTYLSKAFQSNYIFLPLLTGLILTFIVLKKVNGFRFPNNRFLMIAYAILYVSILIVYLFAVSSLNADIGGALIYLIAVSAVFLFLFAVLVPFLVIYFRGDLTRFRFIYQVRKLMARDKKIRQSLRTFALSKQHFKDLIDKKRLLKHYDLFNSFHYSVINQLDTIVPENDCVVERVLFTNLFKIDKKNFYQVTSICYNENGVIPHIAVNLISQSHNTFKVTEKTNISSIREFIQLFNRQEGLWPIISKFSFGEKGNDPSYDDDFSFFGGNSGSFSGGGGNFGGGGASGRW